MSTDTLEAWVRRTANRVNDEWLSNQFAHEALPEIALGSFRADPPGFDVASLLEWGIATRTLPHQLDLSERFGDPPLTLYLDRRLAIDAYLWTVGAPSIHQHGFAGAFHVLAGSSIHSTYDFVEHRRASVDFREGKLTPAQTERLRTGDTRPIIAGPDFIHSLFHLDNPSLSVVIRSRLSNPAQLPQLVYQAPGVAYQSQGQDEESVRRGQVVSAAIKLNIDRAMLMVAQRVRSTTVQGAFELLQRVAREVGFDWKRLEGVIGACRQSHGPWAKLLEGSLREAERRENITSRRRFVTRTDHRLVLAMLLNVTGAKAMMALMREAAPNVEPQESFTRALAELAQLPDPAAPEHNALGVPMDDGALALIRAHCEGARGEKVIKRAHQLCPSAAIPELEKQHFILPLTSILESFFAD